MFLVQYNKFLADLINKLYLSSKSDFN